MVINPTLLQNSVKEKTNTKTLMYFETQIIELYLNLFIYFNLKILNSFNICHAIQ